MKNRIISLLMVLALLTSALAILPVKANPTLLKVEPDTNTFWSGTHSPGYEFTISIIIEDVPDPGMYGWELWLYWDAGEIDCTGETLNNAIWSPNSGPLVAVPINNAAGTYHQGVSGRSPAPPVTGTYWLVNLTFKIVKPVPWHGVITSPLHLGPPAGMTYCIVDKASNEIQHGYHDGVYYYIWSPPTENPHLEVEYTGEPGVHEKTVSGKNIYKTPYTFSVDVVIKNVKAGWILAGVEFLLFYNTTVLDVLSVEEGTFFDAFAPPPQFWVNQTFETEGKIRVGYAVMDIPHLTPPYGEGLIARITFNATYQEKFPASVSSDLNIEIDTEAGMVTYFVDKVGNDIPYDPEVDGKFTLVGYVIGKVIDLFTQYPDPYGGQGPGAPSDMFWPQKEVELYAVVTYNEWPEQNKPVSFEVRNPYGTIMTILTGVTNSSGIAKVSFRMNWPCDKPEDLFGVWTVIATVDVACEMINDTLQFHYDYLVHWEKVTVYDPGEPGFAHCEYIEFTVNFSSYAMQTHWVYIAATLHDELNYPVITGTVATYVQIGGATWCTRKYYPANFRIHVDKSVHAGEGLIHISALTNPPYAGGYALCPEITAKVNILAKWA
jgi:hypothetical protein